MNVTDPLVHQKNGQSIWHRAYDNLKPHLVKTFKYNNDKMLEEKIIEIVLLYLNPPDE